MRTNVSAASLFPIPFGSCAAIKANVEVQSGITLNAQESRSNKMILMDWSSFVKPVEDQLRKKGNLNHRERDSNRTDGLEYLVYHLKHFINLFFLLT